MPHAHLERCCGRPCYRNELGDGGHTAGGVLLGVIFTVLGSVFVANKRVTGLEITHAQKLQEVFLSNARAYLESVYPLHLAQARLASAYRPFQLQKPGNGVVADAAVRQLTESIEEYLSVVNNLMDRAAGAFHLTWRTILRPKRLITFTIQLYGTRMSRAVESTAKVWPRSVRFLGNRLVCRSH
jgi:hypothetical protein